MLIKLFVPTDSAIGMLLLWLRASRATSDDFNFQSLILILNCSSYSLNLTYTSLNLRLLQVGVDIGIRVGRRRAEQRSGFQVSVSRSAGRSVERAIGSVS